MSNPIENFKSTMLNNGINPPDHIIEDGKIHRFGKNKNSWYVYYPDGLPAGSFGNWSKSDQSISWCFKKKMI